MSRIKRATLSILSVSILSVVAATFAMTASAATYRVTDLGVKFPNAFGDFQLNNAGHILGHAVDPQAPAPNKYTFIYANGATTPLVSPPSTYAESVGFNDNDEMTGYLHQTGVYGQRVFVYKNGQFTEPGNALPHSQSGSSVQTINNAGLLLGFDTGHATEVWLYDTNSGQGTVVISSYGGLVASALSNAGHVTGQNFYSGLYHAFLDTKELGSFSAVQRDTNDYSYGLGVNDAGVVVGYAGTPSGKSHAFIYQNNIMADLGTLNGISSSANDINNAGAIVGTSQVSTTLGDSHAFIYASNVMTDLNALLDQSDPITTDIVLVTATSINDRGAILAEGHYTSGRGAKFLLTPVQSSADIAFYNFEQTTLDWSNTGEQIVTLAISSAQKFAGNSSLAVQFNGTGYVSIGAMYPPPLAGKTITFRIYLPADSTIEWVQPFAIEDNAGNWAWHGNWQATSNLQLGAWNTVTLDIPANATPMYRIGVELYTSQQYAGTAYIDSVSF